MSRAQHLACQIMAALILVAAVIALAAVLIFQSGWFRERVRERIISEIETATGARVDIANFSFDWRHLTATVAPLVLHGKEGSDEAPLARLGSVTIRLRVISALERRVDLASLRILNPAIHLVIYPDGTTNWPSPKVPASGDDSWAKNLVDLAVQHYEITDGLIEIDQREIPWNVRGQDLRLSMDYQSASRNSSNLAHYDGRLSSREVQVLTANSSPVTGTLDGLFRLDAEQARFTRLHLTSGHSRADLTGAFTNLRAPRGDFTVRAAVTADDIIPLVSAPIPLTGTAAFDGRVTVTFAHKFDYSLTGRADARNLAYHAGRIAISGATAAGNFSAKPGALSFRDVVGEVAGAPFTAQSSLLNNRIFHVDGHFENAGIRSAAAMLTDQAIAWNGIAAGTFAVDSDLKERNTAASLSSIIAPVSDNGIPLSGQLDLAYDQRVGTLRFGESRLSTAASNVSFSGVLGQMLTVHARTTNLDDVLPALVLLSNNPPKSLPVKLNGGTASIDGSVTGALEQPEFRGQVAANNFAVQAGAEPHGIGQFNANMQASRETIALSGMTLVRGVSQITGDAKIAAGGGDFSNGVIVGRLSLRQIDLAAAIKEVGLRADVAGTASGTVQVSGTLQHPEAEGVLDATKVTAYEQNADHLRATLRYTGKEITVARADADIGTGHLQFSGNFTHPENTWTSGALHAESTVVSLPARAINALRKADPDANGILEGKWTADVLIHVDAANHAAWTIRSLNGTAAARSITYRGSPVGDITFSATSSGEQVAVEATGKLRDSSIRGKGQWTLQGDNPGQASFDFSRLSVDTLHDLVALGGPRDKPLAPPPFQGFIEGGGTVKVSLRDPANFQADLNIKSLEFRPRASDALNANLQRLNVQPQDIQLRNTQPIVIAVSAKEARIRSAHFTARDTDLEVTGLLPFSSTGGADFNVKGNVNLGILQLLNADLLARGAASVTASVHGSLQEPAVNGRMELMNASLYLTDIPNGVDRANGVILFDRNRAVIDHLTAATGGGEIAFKGSIEFGNVLVYRLQADARQVRVRSAEDISITANAQLALNGTSEDSTVTGTLTLIRAAVTQGADIGKVLALASQPSGSPADPSDYLRGMRFDVHIESSPTFQMETSLTRNMQTEVDLRLRGTPLVPALLGTVSASSGDVQLFGNRYTVNRGDVRFTNPVKIEPILDLDLETRARGITVNVTVTGSPQKLNVNYSSDPPLQSREIVALLAVGRDPNSLSQNSQLGTSTDANTGLGDAGGLLGEAFSEQLSNRLQRFFGSSHVKIDPQITGVDTLPSARLTLEQQISRDVTLTYTTNLNSTQEQIVRLEWDFTQQWSAVAVRDANGLFGIDFQYRKRFR